MDVAVDAEVEEVGAEDVAVAEVDADVDVDVAAIIGGVAEPKTLLLVPKLATAGVAECPFLE